MSEFPLLPTLALRLRKRNILMETMRIFPNNWTPNVSNHLILWSSATVHGRFTWRAGVVLRELSRLGYPPKESMWQPGSLFPREPFGRVSSHENTWNSCGEFATWVGKLTSAWLSKAHWSLCLKGNPPCLGMLTLSAHFMDRRKETWTRYVF